MEELLNKFIIDLKCHGYLENTQDVYRKHLQRFFHRTGVSDPSALSIDEIKKYQVYLIDTRKLDPQTVNLNMAAIKFFYLETLKKPWPNDFIVWVKRRKKVPVILSQDEVASVINQARTLKHRTVLMTMYAAGLRSFEAAKIKPSDIDSQRMLIRIEGKGKKERYVVLSPFLLKMLRFYWVNWKHEDKTSWLFPSGNDYSKPFSHYSVKRVYRQCKKRAGITKPGGSHILRHCYATHLLEMGTNLRAIQILLGHAQLRTTEKYTHLTPNYEAQIKNPLDAIAGKLKLTK
jgi:site-specific recombinase XerD